MIRKAFALLGVLAVLAFGQPAEAATTQIIGPANVTTAPLTVNGVPVCLQGDATCPSGGGGGGISSVTINGTNIQVTGSPCSSGACTFGLSIDQADVDAALGYTPCGAASLTGGAYTNANVTVNAAGCVTAIANGAAPSTPGGSSGQIQYNNAGAFGGFTASGDLTINTGTGLATVASIGGVFPGAFYSGTNAANLTGTAPNSVIPAPTLVALGGVEAVTCASHNFIDALSTGGLLACAQPAFSDLSGSINCSQLPALTGDTTTTAGSCATSTTKTGGVAFGYYATGTSAANLTGTAPNAVIPTPGPSVLGGVESILCGTSNWIYQISTAGVPACRQPAFSDISGSLTLSQFPSIADATLLANISGSSGVPTADTLNQIFNHDACSTSGQVWGNSGGTWQCVSPGTPTIPNPLLIPSGGTVGALTGTGAPSSTAITEGSQYFRTDDGLSYVQGIPATTAVGSGNPAYVQTAVASGSGALGAMTLGSSPAVGDVLIAVGEGTFSSPATSSVVAATGWTAIGATQTSTSYAIAVAYHVVTALDTTTQTPFSYAATACGGSAAVIWEVSGVDPQMGPLSLEAVINNANYATINHTTANANDLALFVASGQNCGVNNPPSALTGTSWTNVTAPANALKAGTFLATASATGLVGSATAGFGSGVNVDAMIVLRPVNNANAIGWRPQSFLTTIEANGTPTTANPFSLNFNAAFTVADDGNGDETVGLATSQGSISFDNVELIASQTCLGNGFANTASGNRVDICIGASSIGYFDSGGLEGMAIGANSAKAGTFSSVTDTGITGSTQCLQASSSGGFSGTGAPCPTALGAGGIPASPLGRLTCTSGSPVMSADNAACTTIYYDCYAGKVYPYYSGTADAAATITSCELSTALKASGTGVLNSGDLFDVWATAGNLICVATNGSGGGWSSDTGGSTTARGTGYSQVHDTRGYWTNANSIAHCYNGATDEGALSADTATYLGTIYTTAAGTTKMTFQPAAAAGGAGGCQCLWNAYNRLSQATLNIDSTASWTYATNTWRALDNSNSNRVSYVDGLGQSPVKASLQDAATTVAWAIGLSRDSTSAAPTVQMQDNIASNYMSLMVSQSWGPSIGFHYIQAQEKAPSSSTYTMVGSPNNGLTVELAN